MTRLPTANRLRGYVGSGEQDRESLTNYQESLTKSGPNYEVTDLESLGLGLRRSILAHLSRQAHKVSL